MHDPRSGYVVLISVIVIGAIAGAVAATLLLISTGTTRSRLAYQQGTAARVAADGCLEEGLQKIRETGSFVGTGSLTLASSTCSYVVTGASVPKTVIASSTVGDTTRRVTATVSAVTPRVMLSTWAETPN